MMPCETQQKPETYPDTWENLTAPDGTTLFYQEWRPADTDIRGAVLLVHGFGENAGRYGRMARALNSHGFVVGGGDHRGMGKSGGVRAFVRDYADYDNDLTLFETRLRQNLPPGVPVFLYGHSMGGLIALRYAERHPEHNFAGMALSGPLLGFAGHIPRWQTALGSLMVRVFPAFRVPIPIDSAILTHDREEQTVHANSPYTLRFSTLRWFFATTEAMEQAHGDMKRVAWPTLWLIPGDDRLCAPAASRRAFDHLPASGSHIWHGYPGLFHELHNENPADRDRVLADVVEWMRACLR